MVIKMNNNVDLVPVDPQLLLLLLLLLMMIMRRSRRRRQKRILQTHALGSDAI